MGAGVISGGGFVNTASAGVSAVWEFTYKITTQDIEPGVAFLVIHWSRKSATGVVTTGSKILWKIRQDTPDQVLPPFEYSSTPNATLSPSDQSQDLPATNGRAGSLYSLTYEYTLGYFEHEGRIYKLFVRKTVVVWVPDPNDDDDPYNDVLH